MKFSIIISSLVLFASGITAAPAAQQENSPDRGPPPPPGPPPPTVGLINFWRGGGCAPSSSPCNVNFPIHESGCYTVPSGCSTSATVIGMIPGCTLSIWTNNQCSSHNNVIKVGGKYNGAIGQCEQPGPQIGSISAVCS